jgi:hypothetical protein
MRPANNKAQSRRVGHLSNVIIYLAVHLCVVVLKLPFIIPFVNYTVLLLPRMFMKLILRRALLLASPTPHPEPAQGCNMLAS